MACRSCHPEAVELLITAVKNRNGPEMLVNYINTANLDGESALHYICNVSKDEVLIEGSDRTIVKLLFENGGDVSLQTKQFQETAIHYCALAGNYDILFEILNHLSPSDTQKELNRQSIIGWTPLLIACNKGHMELVNSLLNNHARVDVFDLEGRSALHLAAEHGFQQVCDALLTHKAFINSKSRVGRTALHLA